MAEWVQREDHVGASKDRDSESAGAQLGPRTDCLYFRGRGRETETEIKIPDPLDHCPNAPNIQDWAQMKLEARNSIQISYLSHEHCLTGSVLTGSWKWRQSWDLTQALR